MEELFSDPAVGDFPVSLHLAMIRDKVRMKAFHQALKASIRPGDTVVDIGTGTGVLAILAARCGAGKVVGFDRSDIIR
ncbi:MAG: hypothetical protein HOI95_02800, partial [Chromatiales bacterium]|nr:hypothetical protein [Chromatiales bacterium]